MKYKITHYELAKFCQCCIFKHIHNEADVLNCIHVNLLSIIFTIHIQQIAIYMAHNSFSTQTHYNLPNPSVIHYSQHTVVYKTHCQSSLNKHTDTKRRMVINHSIKISTLRHMVINHLINISTQKDTWLLIT